jgi:hypothetical protein
VLLLLLLPLIFSCGMQDRVVAWLTLEPKKDLGPPSAHGQNIFTKLII